MGQYKNLPSEMNQAIQNYWHSRIDEANKKDLHLFNGVVYAAELYIHLAANALNFSLYETTFDHLLARWLPVNKQIIDGFRYVTCPSLLITKSTETNNEKYFILGLINSDRLLGSSINFIGGTLDQQHAYTANPLKSNLWAECKEEVGIDSTYVNKWSFDYLAETEGAYYLIASLYLDLTIDQMEEHFQQHSQRDDEKEITKLIKVPATKEGVIRFLKTKTPIIRPVADVLQVAVGLKASHSLTDAA
jgi:hypothetical protein